jgi:hypothetical protein
MAGGRRGVSYADSDVDEVEGDDESESKVEVRLGRIITLCYRSSTVYYIHQHILQVSSLKRQYSQRGGGGTGASA